MTIYEITSSVTQVIGCRKLNPLLLAGRHGVLVGCVRIHIPEGWMGTVLQEPVRPFAKGDPSARRGGRQS